MKLYNYLGLKYLKLFSITTLALSLLVLLIDFIELLRRFARKDVSISTIFEISILKQIPLLIEILPFIILISAIIFFTRLSSQSEISVIKSSAVNSKKIFLYPLLIIFIVFIMDITIFRTISEKSKLKHEKMLQDELGIYPEAKNINLWFKENGDQPYIFGAQKIEVTHQIKFINFLVIYLNSEETKIIKSDQAILNDKIITMRGVNIVNNNNEISKTEQLDLKIELDPNIIRGAINNNIITADNNYPFYILLKNMMEAESLKINITKHKALLSNMFAKLIFYSFLFLLAAYFCIFPPRYTKKLVNITITISLSFIVFFILNILFTLTYSGKINVLYGIWLPNIIIIATIIYLNIQAELGKKLWS
jgi:lipopolysaccharide export system permease protein